LIFVRLDLNFKNYTYFNFISFILL